MEKLIKFIKENNLTFNEGERNNNITILCGYTLYNNENGDVELSDSDISDAIEKSNVDYEDINWIRDEVSRVWDFVEYSDYGSFWLTKEASDQYTFEKIN